LGTDPNPYLTQSLHPGYRQNLKPTCGKERTEGNKILNSAPFQILNDPDLSSHKVTQAI
jgi:hypothetical protein